MPLTRQQWCAVLSGLKEAKALEELHVDMLTAPPLPRYSSHTYEGDHSQILSTSELEELVATSQLLVKVGVKCWNEEWSDLMLAIVKGVARNQNVSQLWIAPNRSSRTIPSLVETLAHAHHISHLTWRSSHVVVKTLTHSHHVSCWEFGSQSLAKVLGPNWCQLVIDVLMCRRVCHLSLELSVAEWGEILSRVHQAEQLEEFSLVIDVDDEDIDDENIDDDVVRRAEDVWSMCTLKKVELVTWHLDLPPPWYKLLGAVLRGVAVNRNDLNFVLTGTSHHLSKDDLVSQLGLTQEKVKRFEVDLRLRGVYFISRLLDSTCSSGSDGRPLEETQDKDGELLQSTTDSKKSVPDPVSPEMPSPEVGPVNLPSPEGPPGATEVVPGPVTSEMPSPEVGPVNPPSPQGPPAESTDETSSMSLVKFKKDISSKHQLSVYDQIPSDIGLLAVWKEIPNWEIPIYLGVPLAQVRSLQYKEMGGLEALCLWRDGKCKGSPPPTWNSLLNAVEHSEGPLIRERFEAKVSTEKIWTREQNID